jgi:hypothetical protein
MLSLTSGRLLEGFSLLLSCDEKVLFVLESKESLFRAEADWKVHVIAHIISTEAFQLIDVVKVI